jgi:hypothetical protein
MFPILTADTPTMWTWLTTFERDLSKMEQKLATERDRHMKAQIKEQIGWTRSDVDAIKATLRGRGERV